MIARWNSPPGPSMNAVASSPAMPIRCTATAAAVQAASTGREPRSARASMIQAGIWRNMPGIARIVCQSRSTSAGMKPEVV